jgi:alkylation response protein AidB-like acyl-CoA dehydrogenase
VEFAFGDQHLEFRAQLRAFADKECSPAELRHAWESPLGWSPARWEALAEMGVVGLTVPEPYGGLGMDEIDLVLLLEETGRSGLPEPLLETTGLAAPLLVDAAGPAAAELREEWLPRLASGASIATFGSTAAPAVSAASGAHLLLLEHDDEVVAVPGDAVRQDPKPALDGSRRLARLGWNASDQRALATGAEARDLVARTLDRAAVGSAAQLLGVADRLVTMAAAYAVERHQFGNAIGSFQAVKHHLAGALIKLEFARPLVYRGAWSLASGDADASVHASMAKAQASDAAVHAARVALQVHGAIGYTWEHDLHLWMKRAWALAAAWGDAATHRAKVLAAVAST